jgi:hypothetical protein
MFDRYIRRPDDLRAAFAAELRELVAGHIQSTFAQAFPKMRKGDRELKIRVTLSVMLGALQVMPNGSEVARLAHLTQTKAAVSLTPTQASVRTANHC